MVAELKTPPLDNTGSSAPIRTLAGDTLTERLRRHRGTVLSLATGLLRNSAEAEDITQEVFLRAYLHIPTDRPDPAVRGWLRVVTRNLCLNHLTRYRNRYCLFSDFDEDSEGCRLPEGLRQALVTDPSERDVLQQERLTRALKTLPQKQRDSIHLRHYEHLSYREIAERLGASLAAVRTHLHRARRALRRQLVA